MCAGVRQVSTGRAKLLSRDYGGQEEFRLRRRRWRGVFGILKYAKHFQQQQQHQEKEVC